MAKTLPRPCLNKCGRFVVGRAKVCDECKPLCACGRPKRVRHGTCHHCAPVDFALEPIVWVPNGRGTVVARRR